MLAYANHVVNAFQSKEFSIKIAKPEFAFNVNTEALIRVTLTLTEAEQIERICCLT